MSGSHCPPHWGATIHLKEKKKSAAFQLSKHLTNILKPLTDKSWHKLQSTDNFIHAIKTGQIPDNHKLVSKQKISLLYLYLCSLSLFSKVLLSFWIHKISLSNTQFQPFLGGESLYFLILCIYSINGLSLEDL